MFCYKICSIINDAAYLGYRAKSVAVNADGAS